LYYPPEKSDDLSYDLVKKCQAVFSLWLGHLHKSRFKDPKLENLSFEFWKKYRPPMNRKYREGISEVDVTISYNDGIIFIEAKYLATVNLRTTHDSRRDQIIRYLDLAAYHYLNHPDSIKEFYFVLIIDTEKPPWVLTRYRHNQNLFKGLTNPGLFKPPVDVGCLLLKGIGWLSWKQLRKISPFSNAPMRMRKH
jgi:hypothetical protein